jgi:hypothetical protein
MINFSGNIALVTFRSWSEAGQPGDWRAALASSQAAQLL